MYPPQRHSHWHRGGVQMEVDSALNGTNSIILCANAYSVCKVRFLWLLQFGQTQTEASGTLLCSETGIGLGRPQREWDDFLCVNVGLSGA